MNDRSAEQNTIAEFLKDQKLATFIFSNLKQSLSSIGFSDIFIGDLIQRLEQIEKLTFDVEEFGRKYKNELNKIYNIGFFQKIVPDYFSKYVVPITPTGGKIIDVGCGTGILAKLYAKSGNFEQVIGIDIDPYPEWELFEKVGINFQVVMEKEFLNFLEKEQPETLSITWTLHHMDFEGQKRYLKYIYQVMKPSSQIVILEDAYSEKNKPENGSALYEQFMEHNQNDRAKIMSVYDWITNRILAQRENVPIPFGYRTSEGWKNIFQEIGFKSVLEKFIGFPENRDINTPQCLIVFEK